VRAAQALLRESPLGLAAVADELGYSDAFHLSRQFKAVVGCSPSQWRAGGG